MILVASPKGGVGKTTIAYAVAALAPARYAAPGTAFGNDAVVDTARFGDARPLLDRADRILVVATPELVTAGTVLRALGELPLERVLLVFNRARMHNAEGRKAAERAFGLGARGAVVPEDPALRPVPANVNDPVLRQATRVALQRLAHAARG